jgi:hypothetical protein
MQELSTTRCLVAPGEKSGLVSSTVGWPRSVASLPSAATGSTPWARAKSSARWVASREDDFAVAQKLASAVTKTRSMSAGLGEVKTCPPVALLICSSAATSASLP